MGYNLICALTGFSGGIIVGSGIVAFITVLNIVSRLVHITNTHKYLRFYSWSIWIGAFLASLASLLNTALNLNKYIAALIGTLMGIFVGMIASALAEVLDVIPVSSSRINASSYIRIFILTLAVGKVIGSLLFWIIPELHQ